MSKRPTKGRIKRTRKPCPDCGAPMADGGSVGYYCTKPSCSLPIGKIHLHDTPEDTPQFKADLATEKSLCDFLVGVQVAYPDSWHLPSRSAANWREVQALLRLIAIYRMRSERKR